MSFTLPQYHAPDFQEARFQSAPEARFEPAPKDGVAPRATTPPPSIRSISRWGRWLLAEESRMDCVAALRDGKIAAVEFRNLKAGEPVAVGRTEDASEGIYVYPFGFAEEKGEAETFAFRQGRSRETAYSMDYDSIYELLRHEKEHGRILWVMGPACAFDHDRAALPPWCGRVCPRPAGGQRTGHPRSGGQLPRHRPGPGHLHPEEHAKRPL